MSLYFSSRQQHCNSRAVLPDDSINLGAAVVDRSVEPNLHSSKFAEQSELKEPPPTKGSVHLSNSLLYLTIDSTTERVLTVNSIGATSLGYDPEALIGQPITTLFHLQDQTALRSELAILRSGETQMRQQDYRLLCQDGKIIPQLVTLQPLHNAEAEMILLTCTGVSLQQAQANSSQAEGVNLQQAASFLPAVVAWETLMRAIAQPVRQSLNLKQILQTATAEVQQILQVDRVLIYRANSDKTDSILAESLVADCPTIVDIPHITDILQQKSHQLSHQHSNHLISIDDPNQLAAQSADWLQQLEIKSEIVVPILEQDALWGLLVVHQRRAFRHWKQWEKALLNNLAIHLENIIHHTELYQQEQRLNAALERQIQDRTAQLQLAFDFEATLKRITDKVRDSLKEDQILETAVHELVHTIGINCCNAAIYNLEQGTSTIRYEYTTTVSPYQGRVVQLEASPEIYSQLFEGQAFQFCSLIPNPGRGRFAALTCPIIDDQGVLGDLWLINQPYYGFSEQDIRLVQQVANQCAIAIRQARLYQAAQAQVEELGRLNHLKDDFLSTVSHELRTPMTKIKMATQMLEVALTQIGILQGETNHRVSQYFKILQAECQREIDLIDDLLDLSRLDAELELKLNTIDLSSWIAAIAKPFAEQAHSHHQQFCLDLSPVLPILISDSSYLERILTELLSNACKYTPASETITVSARLTAAQHDREKNSPSVSNFQPAHRTQTDSFHAIRTIDPQHASHSLSPVAYPFLHLSVTNSGVEIPAQELPQIFEKFYRIPNRDPWQHGGTGLGLALVKKLAERLGGTVYVESAQGETCFTLELPLQTQKS